MKIPPITLLTASGLFLAGFVHPARALPLDLSDGGYLHSLNRGEPLLGHLAGLTEPVRFYGGGSANKFYGSVGGGVPNTDTIYATCMADVNGDGNSDIVYLLHVNGAPVNDYVVATYYGYVAGFTVGPREALTLAGFNYGKAMQMEPADMNGDGFPDIVLFARTFSSTYTHHVRVLINNGNLGRFSTSVSVITGVESAAQLRGIAVLHANTDEYLDIMIANRTTNTLTAYINNAGTGFLASPVVVLAESLPDRLWAVDVDRDGKRDLVCASGGADDAAGVVRTLSWRKFQGLSFAAPVTLDSFAATEGEYGGMALGDVNDDGTPDVVFARNFETPTYTSQVWFRAGSRGSPGTFAAAAEITSAAGNDGYEYPVYGVSVADYDRDGDDDLMTHAGYRNNDGFVSERILGNARVHGESAGVVASYSGTAPTGITSMTTADVNGDSWMDLVAASAGSRVILWYPGLPAGGFGPAVSISTGAAPPATVVAGDIDHDGDCDLAWAQISTGEVKRAFNTNKIGTAWSQATLLSVPGILSVTSGNANADSDVDLISVTDSGAVTWHYNGFPGDGSVWTPELVQTLPGARRAAIVRTEVSARSQVATAGVGLSGDPAVMNVKHYDFIATPRWQTMISENGTVSGTSTAVVSGDFDRDGNVDIAWAAGSNEVKWRNPVAAVSPTVSMGTAPGNVRTLRCMDWNSDGWDDVLCAHSTGVTVWLRKSSTVWTALSLYTGGDCTDAVPIHIDHDAHMDVAAVDTTAGTLKLITHGPVAQMKMLDTPVTAGGASLRMNASQTAYVLKLDCSHLGNRSFSLGNGGFASDAAVTLSHLRVRFVNAVPTGNTWTPGIVLSDSAVAASVDKVLLVKESTAASNPTLDANDTVLAEAAVSTSFGYMSLTVNNPAIEFEPGNTIPRYYIALKMKPGASSVATGRFFVQHVIDPQLTGSRARAPGEYPASVLLNTTGPSSTGQLINITTPYETWRFANFNTYNNSGNAGDNFDGDKDGLNNLDEYILRRNPLQPDVVHALKFLPGFGATPLVRMELPAAPREDGIITVQQSSALGDWTTLSQRTGNGVWTGAPVTSVISFDGITHWNIHPAAQTRTFFRFSFSVQP